MRYEIDYLDGLYCVFRNSRIEAAFDTKEEALEAVRRYREGEKNEKK